MKPLIAICGAPGSGKTTAAQIMERRFGAEIIDDGEGLRQACMAFFGMSYADCYTQSGKARKRIINGVEYTNRQILGDVGKLFESFYGQNVIAEQAVARMSVDMVEHSAPFFVFPSVRMKQGLVYRRLGGYVIEIVRDGCEPVNDFDHYDKSLVDCQIVNNHAIDEFEDQVECAITCLLRGDFL